MIIRHPITILTLAAFLMAGGAALAGGMPSDEGPEVILDEIGYDDGGSLDGDTITAIIKSQIPQDLPAAYVPATYVVAVTTAEAPSSLTLSVTELPPAPIIPDDELKRDHR